MTKPFIPLANMPFVKYRLGGGIVLSLLIFFLRYPDSSCGVAAVLCELVAYGMGMFHGLALFASRDLLPFDHGRLAR